MKRHFCTYFDRNYLTRGLALHQSLVRHAGDFRLYALCLDADAHRALVALRLPHLVPVALEDFLRDDPALAQTRSGRSTVEFYFTCTPSLPRYLLAHHSEIEQITYLDADLFFLSDLAPLFAEIGAASIAIISHRFPPRLRHMVQHGIYNVGFLSFRRDPSALACLEWWRDQCIAWCYARLENGQFGDQKYLDDWPTRFANVIVLEHRGGNVAFWNLENHPISLHEGRLLVGGQMLIFFHVHSLRQLRPWLYDLQWRRYDLPPNPLIVRHVFAPYLRALGRAERRVRGVPGATSRRRDCASLPDHVKPATDAFHHRLSARFYTVRAILRRITSGEYLPTLRGFPLVVTR